MSVQLGNLSTKTIGPLKNGYFKLPFQVSRNLAIDVGQSVLLDATRGEAIRSYLNNVCLQHLVCGGSAIVFESEANSNNIKTLKNHLGTRRIRVIERENNLQVGDYIRSKHSHSLAYVNIESKSDESTMIKKWEECIATVNRIVAGEVTSKHPLLIVLKNVSCGNGVTILSLLETLKCSLQSKNASLIVSFEDNQNLPQAFKANFDYSIIQSCNDPYRAGVFFSDLKRYDVDVGDVSLHNWPKTMEAINKH